MSQGKRRSEQLAPALFPFMAVLLCLIGALVLILAITVTNSHASARNDAKTALLQVEDETKFVKAVSQEQISQREQIKKEVELRRSELQHMEDHIKRLNDELERLRTQFQAMEESGESVLGQEERTKLEIDRLKSEIDRKKQELANEVEKLKKKKPAFAIVPYSGKNGTNRRPIYVECTSSGVILRPEGILLSPRDLIPPGPGNPLAASLRYLRNQYEQADARVGISQPPYPLLLVRPDGVQAYAYARQALTSWDDQYGYELIDSEMELAFPPSAPGAREELEKVVASAKQRQQALLASNPKLAREYEISTDQWEDSKSVSNHSLSPDFRANQGTASGGGWVEGDSTWKMVKPSSPYAAQGGALASANGGSFPKANSTSDPNSPAGTGDTQLLADSFDPNVALQNAVPGQGGTVGTGAAMLSDNRSAPTMEPNSSSRNLENGQGSNSDNWQDPQPNQNIASSTNSNAPTTSSAGGNGSASSPSSGGSFQNQPSQAASSSNSSTASGAGSSTVSGTPMSPQSQNPEDQSAQIPLPSFQFQKDDSKNAKYVKADADQKPIAVTAGKNWAQAKSEGKATPVSRTIQIVVLNNKWLFRSDSDPTQFETVILLEDGPQKVTDQLTSTIRSRVEAWGLSLPGGYWVPLVIVEVASDAQISHGRLERLLDGSGVEMKVVPLVLPR